MKTMLVLILMMAVPAYATNKPPEKPVTPTNTSQSVSSATAKANAAAKASSNSAAKSSATGGSAKSTATGGAGGNASTGPQSQDQSQNASADNAGNTQTLHQTYEQVRQAPSVGQGSIIPPACGAGGNAGGSNSTGAAFLGFSWVTADCHRYITAQNYLALGMPEFACEILNTTKTSKRVVSELGIELPACGKAKEKQPDAVPTVVVVPTVDPGVDAKIERAFKQTVSK